MISAGVFLGAPTPIPGARLVARHELAHGRHVRQRLRARRGGHRQRAQLAGPDVLDRRGTDAEHDLHLSAEQIGQRRSAPRYGTWTMFDAGHHLEQLAGDMGRGPVAGRRHVDLARIGLGVGDELGNGLGRNRWIHHHDIGRADDAGDRRDVADEIEIELVVERRVDRVRRTDQQQRIAVGGARTTASVPILLPAPGRFSMMNCWPSRSDSHCPIRRAMMSVAPAGGKPTMMRTGRAG